MLKSTLVMALESRLTAVEGECIPFMGRHWLIVDLGRQTLIHGNKVPVEEMCAKIDNLTLEVCHQLVPVMCPS
jgi:processing peptidase subunit alpha